MKIKDLLHDWEASRSQALSQRELSIRLNRKVAAQISALAEIYGRSESEVISDMLSVALEDLRTALPYVKGEKVIAEDEFGDPIYEDAGPMPRFLALSKQYEAAMVREEKHR